VDPKINEISPTNGPMFGGTRLIIYGEHLNAGSLTKALVDKVPCEILLLV
jgi:hypothetical protein